MNAENRAPLVVMADDRMAALQEQFHMLKADADEANARLDAVKAAIKLALSEAAPGAEKVELPARGEYAGLSLSYRESWRINATKLKAEDPLTYASYAVKSGSWTLSVAGGRS